MTAFEKLTTDLPARDTLLPRAFWFLARAHEHRGEHILAATSYSRLVESFPDDTLADDAALAAAREYRKMWRKPALDPTYGETALATYNTLLGLYPTSPLIPAAKKELAELEDQFAQKNYLSGMYYLRRKAYDSGIIYFKDILAKYPTRRPRVRHSFVWWTRTRPFATRKTRPTRAPCSGRTTRMTPKVKLTCQGVAAPVAVAPAVPANASPVSTGPPSTTPPATPRAF